MARYTEAKCRLCRREGQKLFLKGDRCFTDKCAYERRPYAPGFAGKLRKKLSAFATLSAASSASSELPAACQSCGGAPGSCAFAAGEQ